MIKNSTLCQYFMTEIIKTDPFLFSLFVWLSQIKHCFPQLVGPILSPLTLTSALLLHHILVFMPLLSQPAAVHRYTTYTLHKPHKEANGCWGW